MCRTSSTRYAFHALAFCWLALAVVFTVIAPPASESWQCFPPESSGETCVTCFTLDQNVQSQVDWFELARRIISELVGGPSITTTTASPTTSATTTLHNSSTTTSRTTSVPTTLTSNVSTTTIAATSGNISTTTSTAATSNGSSTTASVASPLSTSVERPFYFSDGEEANVMGELRCDIPARYQWWTVTTVEATTTADSSSSTTTTSSPAPTGDTQITPTNSPRLCCCFPAATGIAAEAVSLRCPQLAGRVGFEQVAPVLFLVAATLFVVLQLVSEAFFRVGAVQPRYKPGISSQEWNSYLAQLGASSRMVATTGARSSESS